MKQIAERIIDDLNKLENRTSVLIKCTQAYRGFQVEIVLEHLLDERNKKDCLNEVEVSKLPTIEKISFIGKGGQVHEAWVTENRVYVLDELCWPQFEWANKKHKPILRIPTVGLPGYYRERKI